MDAWAWSAIGPWAVDRAELPVGALFCVIDGPTRGRAWSDSAARVELHQARAQGRRQAPVRTPPAQARARRRAHARGDPAAADPAPTRPLAPVNDRHLPRRDQHRRDHLDRPRPARADDARQRRPRPLAGTRGSAAALPHPRPPWRQRCCIGRSKRQCAAECPIASGQRCAQPRSIQNVSVISGGSISMPSFSNARPSVL